MLLTQNILHDLGSWHIPLESIYVDYACQRNFDSLSGHPIEIIWMWAPTEKIEVPLPITID
jgi:hypothetical protein